MEPTTLLYALIARAFVHRFSDVNTVVQYPVQEVLAHGVTTRCTDAAPGGFPCEFRGGSPIPTPPSPAGRLCLERWRARRRLAPAAPQVLLL